MVEKDNPEKLFWSLFIFECIGGQFNYIKYECLDMFQKLYKLMYNM